MRGNTPPLRKTLEINLSAKYGTDQGDPPNCLVYFFGAVFNDRRRRTWFENNVRNYIIPLAQRLPLIIASMVRLCHPISSACQLYEALLVLV